MNASRALNIVVVTVSDTRTLETDSSGQVLVEFISRAEHRLAERAVVKDELLVIRSRVLEYCKREEVDVVVLTGGTGITSRDVTPEALEPIFEKAIPGFGELFRYLSYEEIGAATIQSRALAGVCQ